MPGILGGLAEVTVFRPLYRKGELAQVLLTIGLVFVATAVVTEIFGAFPYPVKFPDYLTKPVDIGFRTYPGLPAVPDRRRRGDCGDACGI